MLGFFKKSPAGSSAEAKLPGPKGMPEIIGSHLVIDLKMNPNWVWDQNLKVLVRDGDIDGRPIVHVRVPDWPEAEKRKVTVQDYDSLNAHPDLILVEGYYEKKGKGVHLEEKNKPAKAK